ncbi:hypothetical protein QMA10_00415 [Arthrobacter sp. APC 3897]|uniref:hypothetical protein n=1 Tax=Arthrobacter sp. APC 3897 TaxID=3035204 RepID=UPI0025B461B8|nr:hypothetical protein [Arthrobacter sp. APC 3897]MDN3480390.1 hypothetical protein [Arthrobacter sp. APC 3897]
MSIDWFAYLVVALVTLVATLLVVGLYSTGVRLYAISSDAGPGPAAQGRPTLVRAGAYACFALCAAAVLFGVYLIVPALHF